MNYRKEKYAIPYLIVFCLIILSLTVYLGIVTDLNGFILERDKENVVDLTRAGCPEAGRRATSR